MRALAVLAALSAPVPAVAQGAFAPPSGCTPVLTVQHRQCLLYNVWTCAADAPGIRWSARFMADGLESVRMIDSDSQWLARYYFDPATAQEMDVPATDPASIAELLKTGADSYDYTMRVDGVFSERTLGVDELTGVETIIDGEPLLELMFHYADLDEHGDVLSQAAGRQYLSVRHRLFIVADWWPVDQPDQVSSVPPVDFVYPGEPGFFASLPAFDCDVVLSGFGPEFDPDPAQTSRATVLRATLFGD